MENDLSNPENSSRIQLAHGSGGRLTRELVRREFLSRLENPALAALSDSALLSEPPPGRLAFTTDTFVVDPPVFPGGDLGHLSVCGTVNDLAVAGARPLWRRWAVILAEGADEELIRTFAAGVARAAGEAGVQIVAGDTKVVPRGKGDGIYAATSGIGVVPPGLELGDEQIREGDAVIVSGPIGDHGIAVMAARHGITGSGLRSDCAPLGGLTGVLLDSGLRPRSMHDPTRGGLAVTCHEVCERSGLGVRLDEEAVPVRPEARAVCDLLGIDPYYAACEGRIVVWVAETDAERALAALRSHVLGREAAVVGRVTRQQEDALVILRNRYGADRPLDLLSGIDLPRIC